MTTKTDYYKADISILTWQGICPTKKDDEYLITGTLTNGQGALIKGPISTNNSPIETIIYPNSTSTEVYGPEENDCDKITLVGSYQTGPVGITEPCNAFIYHGKYGDFYEANNYFEIIPPEEFPFNVAHSTRGGLAVYISSTKSGLNLDLGKSFIFDIEKKETITEVIYPDAVFTTTYGIWHNGCDEDFDSYTISGGFSMTGQFIDTRIYVVDFLYNKKSCEMHFENWNEISLQSPTLFSHAQGITGLGNGNYILPTAIFEIDPLDPSKFIQLNGETIQIKKQCDKFIITNNIIYDFPRSSLTFLTSAAKNTVVGFSVNTSGDPEFSFQAVTKEIILY